MKKYIGAGILAGVLFFSLCVPAQAAQEWRKPCPPHHRPVPPKPKPKPPAPPAAKCCTQSITLKDGGFLYVHTTSCCTVPGK